MRNFSVRLIFSVNAVRLTEAFHFDSINWKSTFFDRSGSGTSRMKLLDWKRGANPRNSTAFEWSLQCYQLISWFDNYRMDSHHVSHLAWWPSLMTPLAHLPVKEVWWRSSLEISKRCVLSDSKLPSLRAWWGLVVQYNGNIYFLKFKILRSKTWSSTEWDSRASLSIVIWVKNNFKWFHETFMQFRVSFKEVFNMNSSNYEGKDSKRLMSDFYYKQ